MRVLVVATAWPWPTRKGHQLRALQLAEQLALRHDVVLLAPADEGPVPPGIPFAVRTYRAARRVEAALGTGGVLAALFRGRSLQSGLFASSGLSRELRESASGFDRIVLQTVRQRDATAHVEGDRTVVDFIDSLALGLARRALLERVWLRPLLRFESRRLASDERFMVGFARRALVVCERDRAHLALALGELVASRLAVVPLALAETAPAEPFASREIRLVISGNLGYFPTEHGVRWFVTEVWPELLRHEPRLRLLVAGSRPATALSLAVRAAGGEVEADPADLGKRLRSADLALVPLFAGAGTPIKLLDAIAAAVPAVATSWAAAGLEPELARFVTTADEPARWVEAILAQVSNPEGARARALAARELARSLHSPARVGDLLDAALR